MKEKKTKSTTAENPRMYMLKIAIEGLPVWRRVVVREDINLGLLHAVIQVVMGWTNSHLHQFIIEDIFYMNPRMNEDMSFDDAPIYDEGKTRLMDVVKRARSKFIYEYDFGDSWMHSISVEKIIAPEAATKYFAECIGGEKACPPDDCGGPYGYEELLEIIQDPDHEEYESMMEWLGGSFDPNAFDIKRANTYLHKLKWPCVTEMQLARVLMARDGYKG